MQLRWNINLTHACITQVCKVPPTLPKRECTPLPPKIIIIMYPPQPHPLNSKISSY